MSNTSPNFADTAQAAAEQVEPVPVDSERHMDAAGMLYDPLFDHLL